MVLKNVFEQQWEEVTRRLLMEAALMPCKWSLYYRN